MEYAPADRQVHTQRTIVRLISSRLLLATSAVAARCVPVAAAACVMGVGLIAQPTPVDWRSIAPGVEHAELTRKTDEAGQPAGPWVINALRIDPSQARLDIVHAQDEAVGLETVGSVAERRGAIAAVNGGYFRMTGTFAGDSTGTLQIDGKLLSEPDRGRAAVGLVRAGNTTHLVMGHVSWHGSAEIEGRKRTIDGINRPRGKNEVVLFTPEFHQTTLTDSTGTELIVRQGRVISVRDNAGSSRIPSDGYVLSTRGSAREWARSIRRGTRAKIAIGLNPLDSDGTLVGLAKPANDSQENPWAKAEDILGAGPKLVSRGRVDITAGREKMLASFATDRHPRTAIASLADGRILLVVVDGRQPTLSVGMSLDELARLLIDLDAVEAMNLDGGGSTTMVVQGKVVNHPSDVTGERPVSDAILVLPQ